jgi:hypothetical protein
VRVAAAKATFIISIDNDLHMPSQAATSFNNAGGSSWCGAAGAGLPLLAGRNRTAVVWARIQCTDRVIIVTRDADADAARETAGDSDSDSSWRGASDWAKDSKRGKRRLHRGLTDTRLENRIESEWIDRFSD